MITLLQPSDLDKYSDSINTLGKIFDASSEHLGRFNIELFKANWKKMLAVGGLIFAQIDGDNIVGMLGAFEHDDMYNGDRILAEMFWFVHPDHRGSIGVRLYLALERLARDRYVNKIQMVHLMDSMPDKLMVFYTSHGYKLAEARYVKEL